MLATEWEETQTQKLGLAWHPPRPPGSVGHHLAGRHSAGPCRSQEGLRGADLADLWAEKIAHGAGW